MAGRAMVAARRIIALPVETEQRRALVEISRSRTEPANRVVGSASFWPTLQNLRPMPWRARWG